MKNYCIPVLMKNYCIPVLMNAFTSQHDHLIQTIAQTLLHPARASLELTIVSQGTTSPVSCRYRIAIWNQKIGASIASTANVTRTIAQTMMKSYCGSGASLSVAIGPPPSSVLLQWVATGARLPPCGAPTHQKTSDSISTTHFLSRAGRKYIGPSSFQVADWLNDLRFELKMVKCGAGLMWSKLN